MEDSHDWTFHDHDRDVEWGAGSDTVHMMDPEDGSVHSPLFEQSEVIQNPRCEGVFHQHAERVYSPDGVDEVGVLAVVFLLCWQSVLLFAVSLLAMLVIAYVVS